MILKRARSLVQRAANGLRKWVYDRPLGDTVVILLTNPRSGSTWVFDMLRAHPCIAMHPCYEVHTRLHLSGRRYPRDLSNLPDATKRIEVLPEKWERVPDLSLGPCSGRMMHLEKIHPHFFDYDAASFLHEISRLRETRDVQMIYQVRDPEETLVSFLEYKRRNPSWDSRKLPQIAIHLRRIFETMQEIHAVLEGPVIDYQTLSSHPDAEMNRLFLHLTGEHLSSPEMQEIQSRTRRNKKKKSGTSFVGSTRSDELIDDYASYFSDHVQEIDCCYAAYQLLLRASTTSPSSN